VVKPCVAGVLAAEHEWITYWYMRDVQGNILAVYKQQSTEAFGVWHEQITLEEWDLYGSARLGTCSPESPLILANRTFELVNNQITNENIPSLAAASDKKIRKLGEKVFELVNHLGNIISTISDRKLMHEDLPNNPGLVHHYTAEILSVQEQYAFGMNMPGRSYNVSAYRYGWNNGSVKDDEITGVTGAHITTYFREYETRIGRTWTPDPVFHPWQSPYTSMDNNPIAFNDPLGDWVKGAGFFKNIFNSDDKIKAEINSKALADATGGTVFKDGNGWTVNYTSGVRVNYGKGHFKMREFNVVHFKYKPGTLENFSNWFKNSTESFGDYLALGSGGVTGIDVSGLSMANGLFGTAVGFGEVSTLAGQGKYITSKGLVRDINFKKLTQHSTPYAKAGKILKSWVRSSAVLGFAVDAYAFRDNQISGIHFGANTGITAWGLGVGAAGMAVPAFIGGSLYFGMDTFYPGGFNGAMQMNGSLIEQNQQVLGPGFNLYRDH
jgi:hypothetical protein